MQQSMQAFLGEYDEAGKGEEANTILTQWKTAGQQTFGDLGKDAAVITGVFRGEKLTGKETAQQLLALLNQKPRADAYEALAKLFEAAAVAEGKTDKEKQDAQKAANLYKQIAASKPRRLWA